ncbi:MAG: ABC transporter permease [Bacteroidia bacterium]
MKLLLISFVLCMFAPVWINDKPILGIDQQGNWHFPVFEISVVYQDTGKYAFAINPPVCYTPGKGDMANSGFKGPFHRQYVFDARGELTDIPVLKRHWFGTDLRGGDVLAYTVFGLRNSMVISILAIIISLVIASFLGFAGGWYSSEAFVIGRTQLLVILLWLLFAFHGLVNLYTLYDKYIFLLLITVCCALVMFRLRKIEHQKTVNVRIDFFSDRLSEIFVSIPRMVLLMVMVQFVDKSISSIALVIGLTGWVDLARLIRSETIRLKDQPFIDAAMMNGVSRRRLFLKHIFPNIWPSVMVVSMYAFSGNIIMESSMSFFGMGLPPESPSVGTMLSEARSYYEYWWLFIIPGFWLSMLIYALFTLPGRFGRPTIN